MTTAVMMSKVAAQALTVRIRESATNFGELLLEAQDGEAWRALGYASWGAYVDGEFDFKRSRSYQLLTQAKVNKALAAAGSDLRVNERAARELSTMVDSGELVRRAEERVRDALPKPSGKKRHGPPDLSSRLREVRERLEWLSEQMELAGDDALAYMDASAIRDLERTASACYDWGEAIIAKLQEPRERRYIEESA